MKTATIMMMAAFLAAVALGFAPTAYAGAPKVPPSIGDIEGVYVVSGKFYGYDFDSPNMFRGKYKKDVIIITQVDTDEVELEWYDSEGGFYGSWRGLYQNGVLLIGKGDDGSEPAEEVDMMIIEFSGSPGKVKMSGKNLYYDLNDEYVYGETFKGKQVM